VVFWFDATADPSLTVNRMATLNLYVVAGLPARTAPLLRGAVLITGSVHGFPLACPTRSSRGAQRAAGYPVVESGVDPAAPRQTRGSTPPAFAAQLDVVGVPCCAA
jgi:hypothetical protein